MTVTRDAFAAIGISVVDRVLRRRTEPAAWYRTWRLRLIPHLAPVGLAGAIFTFVAGLAAKWQRGTTGLTIGGIVQAGDSGIYHGRALRLLFDGHLDDWSSRRPPNAGFLAVRYSDRSPAYWPSPYSLEIVRVESVAR